MQKMGRWLLWSLGALAIFWTAATIGMLMAMPAGCPMCAMMPGGRSTPSTSTAIQAAGGMGMVGMSGAAMWWMMASIALTWIVMTALDVAFVYLIVSTIYRRRMGGAAPTTA